MGNLIDNSKGYTLIQLIVVIAILGILTAVSVPVYYNAKGKAQDATAVATIEAMRTAFEMSAVKNGHYPKDVYTVTDLLIALGRDFPYNVKFDGRAGSLMAVATNSIGSAYYVYAIGRDANHYFGSAHNILLSGPDSLFNCKVSVDTHKPFIGKLFALLKDPDNVVRNSAVKRLGAINDLRAIKALTEALEDEDANVRASAKEELERLKEKNSVKKE